MKLTSKNKRTHDSAYTEYTGTKGKFKFKAHIYEDGSGFYKLLHGRHVIDYKEDETIKYWKEDLAFDKEKNQVLEDFFSSISEKTK